MALARRDISYYLNGEAGWPIDFNFGSHKGTNLAAAVAGSDAARLDQASGTNPNLMASATFNGTTALPAPWVHLPQESNGQARTTSHALAAGGVTLRTDTNLNWFTDDAFSAPVGVTRRDGSQGWTCTVKVDVLTPGVTGANRWRLFIGVAAGGTISWSSYAGIVLEYRPVGPDWLAFKRHKHPNATTHVESSGSTIASGSTPSAVWLRIEWNDREGYKVWWSTDDASYTEVGGGAVATGYIDAFRMDFSFPSVSGQSSPPDLLGRAFLIAAGQNQSGVVSTARVVSLTASGVT